VSHSITKTFRKIPILQKVFIHGLKYKLAKEGGAVRLKIMTFPKKAILGNVYK
jgi:hypothetical protein